MASQQKPPPASYSSKQRLALAICHFLNASTADGILTAEDKDSVDVAVNCIADSFKVDPTDQSAMDAAVGSQSLLQIYSVYEKLKEGSSAPNSSAAPAATESPTEEQKKEAESLKSKGNAAMAQRHYATAIDLYTQALRLNPSNAVFLSNRAAAHSAARDHSSALIDAEAAVALDLTYTKAWSRLGLARFALGDPKGAMEAYQKGIHYEGNGGSDAMRRGYETAKRRTEEVAQSDPQTVPQAAANDDSVSRGGGGGMTDLSAIMNNPMFSSMAQNLMSNPDLMGNLMSNPRLRDMADQFTQGGGMPDLSSLMSDPKIAEMARNMIGGHGNSSNSNNNNGGSGGDP